MLRRAVSSLLLLALLLPLPAHARREAPLVSQDCGCTGERFALEQSSLAFKGTLTRISETRQDVRGFQFYFVDLTFRIEKAWHGLPQDVREFTLRTDSTSCGYGRIFAPDGRVNAVGSTFGVFASEPFLNICNSVVVDETWFPKNLNPFESPAVQPLRPQGNWTQEYPPGWGDYIVDEAERREKERKEGTREYNYRQRESSPQQYHR